MNADDEHKVSRRSFYRRQQLAAWWAERAERPPTDEQLTEWIRGLRRRRKDRT